MASLNIKNEETVQLVRELSRRTGQSMTGAITLAVKAELEREKPEPKAEGVDAILRKKQVPDGCWKPPGTRRKRLS